MRVPIDIHDFTMLDLLAELEEMLDQIEMRDRQPSKEELQASLRAWVKKIRREVY